MQIHPSMAEISQAQWNSLVQNSNGGTLHPAMRHEYLLALEESGSAVPETGWAGVHLTLQDGQGSIKAAAPLYLKSHSYGEYVFDWSWAQAFERSGLVYYPKLLCAIPFTPVLAPKLLAADETSRHTLAQGLLQFAIECASENSPIGVRASSLHALFLNQLDLRAIDDSVTHHFATRSVVQFHWKNHNPLTNSSFVDFEDYLSSLTQKKRKNVRAERRKAHVPGLAIQRKVGKEISEQDLDFFYDCYTQTYLEHHSSPYLTHEFFQSILTGMGEQILLCIAELDGKPVATSLLLFNEDRLYGRYWGALATIPCLHFELCYYQAIEFAIERGIQYFEGGAQGEHKMARGLNPEIMSSVHWLGHKGLHQAVERFTAREEEHLQMYVHELGEHQAFRNSQSAK